MKRFLAMTVILFASVTGAFAQWTPVVGTGVAGLWASSTLTKLDNYHNINRHGFGGDLNFDFRLINDNGFALMTDTNVAAVKLQGDIYNYFDWTCGAGYNLLKNNDKTDLIISGIAGVGYIFRTDSNATYSTSGYEFDCESEFSETCIVGGADIYGRRKLNDKWGIYGEVTMFTGLGKGHLEYTDIQTPYGVMNYKSDAETDIFSTLFKFGACYQF